MADCNYFRGIGYLEALCSENVEVITAGIDRCVRRALTTLAAADLSTFTE